MDLIIVVALILLGLAVILMMRAQKKSSRIGAKDSPQEEYTTYITEGMSLGMLAGIALSLAFGDDQLALGISLGMLMGMVIGMNIEKMA